MAKILLIDGSNYLFRAFHGLPDLRTTEGEPVAAMRGFLTMLGKAWAMSGAELGAVVFDAPGKNFRHEMYPEYKQNRPPMPDDLRVQIAPLQQVITDLGWPLIMVPGVEADDVLATLADRAVAAGYEAVIATGDKDMAQLVDGNITLLNTMNDKLYDREAVIEKYGVPPERIIDYLALMGDKVDNVPGIEKCGPKTAAKWITQYGDISGVRAAAPEMKGKIGEYLRAGLPFLDDAVRLVTIKRDCELPENCAMDALFVKPASREAVTAFCLRWQMSSNAVSRAAVGGFADAAESAQAELAAPAEEASVEDDSGLGGLFAAPAAAPAPKKAPVKTAAAPAATAAAAAVPVPAESTALLTEPVDEVPFESVDTSIALMGLADELQAAPRTMPVALSLIWDGEARHARVAGLGIAVSCTRVAAVVCGGELTAERVFEILSPWLSSDAPKVMHDAKSTLHAISAQGVTVGGVCDDTMLMSYVLEAHLGHDLTRLSARHLSRVLASREALLGKGAKAIEAAACERAPLEKQLAEEALAVRALSSVLGSRLEAEPGLLSIYTTIERPLVPVLARMEASGVAIDCMQLAQQAEAMGRRIDQLTEDAAAMAGHSFNLSSPKQLGTVLFTELGLPVKKKTASGTPSTDEEVLTELAYDYPLPKLILEHRRLTKLKGTYLDKLPRMVDPADGRVHTTFSQAVAVTGRLASSDPNLQNIPVRTAEGRQVREAFVAEYGNRVISADYSQIELRIMAHLSQDKGLLDAFAHGVDVHRATAAEVFGRTLDQVTPDERRMAKVINFGLIYGMSAFGLAQNLGIDRKVAAHYIEEYFLRYPGVKRYMEEKRAEAHERGYVETAFGRRLWIPDIRSSRKPVQAAAERAAINAPMQGTAADIIKKAMIAVDAWLRDNKMASRLVLQVHDELIIDAPESEVAAVREALPALMAAAADLSVPLIAEVGVGDSWEKAH